MQKFSENFSKLFELSPQQAENFCNSIGVLQMHAKPSYFNEFEKSKQNQPANGAQQEDFAQLFAKLIVKTAKDIDVLIDSLPSEESTPELQVNLVKSGGPLVWTTTGRPVDYSSD